MDESLCFPDVVVPSLNDGTDTLKGLFTKIEEDKAWFEKKLSQSGALLLRGFRFKDPADFAQLVKAFGYRVLHDIHGSHKRRHIDGPVYSANENTPLEIGIDFHNELTYMPEYPDLIMFYCEVPPPKDGAGGTGIVRDRVVYDTMCQKFPEFMRDLEAKGVKYYHIVDESELSSWECLPDVVPLENGRYKMSRGPLPGIIELDDGKKTWFNCIGSHYAHDAGYACVEYGDGTPMPVDALESARELMNDKQSVVEWKQGDVLILDNLRVLHSRHPSKTPRVILVSMLKY